VLNRLLRRREKRIDPGAECFRAFFREKFGQPGRSQTIYRHDDAPMIDIEVYRAPWDRDVYALVSVGLSFYSRPDGERAEVMLLVDEVPWDAERALGRIVGLLAEEPKAFALGEFYEGVQSFGAITKRYGKTAMVLMTPQVEGQSLFHVDCDDGPGHVFQLVPITAGERDLLAAEGLPALQSRLVGSDVSDLSRAGAA
jgi:hypothetical protein